MSLSEYKSGTASVTSSETSLVNNSTSIATDTTHGVYQLFLDVSALAAGDQYEIYLREKVISGGTQRQISLGVLTGAQLPLWVAGAFQLKNGWDFTIKKLAGTDRSIPFSIRKAG